MSLSAETLPDVQAGSVALYRKFEVGEVITVRPRANAFDIDLHIKPEYHLLTSNSVFWAEAGAKVQLNGSGLTVQASPLSRALKGAISFDNLSGASASQRKGDKRILMLRKQRPVRLAGRSRFTLSMPENWRSGCQFAIRQSIFGQIQTLDLITARNEVQEGGALSGICPDFCSRKVRASQWSHRKFRQLALSIKILSSSRISTSNQAVASVPINKRPPLLIRVTWMGLSIIVEAPEAGSLGIGTPVLFRGLEVGTVTGLMDIVRSRDDCDAHQ